MMMDEVAAGTLAETWLASRGRSRLIRVGSFLAYLVIFPLWDWFDDTLAARLIPSWPPAFFHWLAAALLGAVILALVGRIEAHEQRLLQNTLARTRAAEESAHAADLARAHLEAIQATARAVAHHLNQPLAVMRGYLELYLESAPEERDEADVQRALREIDRAALTVRELQRARSFITTPTGQAGGLVMLDLSAQNGDARTA